MKDMLNRDIMVGDTLAYVAYDISKPTYPIGALKLAKVTAVAPFALQLTKIQEDKDVETFVISDASNHIICDWGHGV